MIVIHSVTVETEDGPEERPEIPVCEFPRGAWYAAPDPDRPGKTAWFVTPTGAP